MSRTLLPPLHRLAAALVLALAPTAIPAQEADAPTETEAEPSEPTVEVTPQEADGDIARRIEGILEATGWYRGARVEVREGVVFLDGTTSTEERQDWARSLALRTEGVAAVVNRLDVLPEVSWDLAPAAGELRRLTNGALAALPLIGFAVIVLPLSWIAARLVGRLIRHLLAARVRTRLLRDVLARAVAIPVFLVGVYVVLQIAGLTQLAVSLIGGAGILGIVVGFAFRDIAENFLASLLLGLRQPFRRGDLVVIDAHRGFVHSMNTRSTVLVSEDGNHIQIPNAVVFKTVIQNLTAAASQRGELSVGIGYDDSVADAQRHIQEVLAAHPAVADDPAPMALVDGLGAATVNLKGYFWFDGREYSPLKLRSMLLRRIKAVLTERGVSMPDEAREVIFPQGVPVVGMDGAPPERPAPAEEAAVSAAETDLSSEAETLDEQMVTPVEAEGDDLLRS